MFSSTDPPGFSPHRQRLILRSSLPASERQQPPLLASISVDAYKFVSTLFKQSLGLAVVWLCDCVCTEGSHHDCPPWSLVTPRSFQLARPNRVTRPCLVLFCLKQGTPSSCDRPARLCCPMQTYLPPFFLGDAWVDTKKTMGLYQGILIKIPWGSWEWLTNSAVKLEL